MRTAARFGLLAWEDPFDEAGPASPFWSEAPVALAMVAPPGLAGATLAEAMVRDGAGLSGLRLLDGTLLLKVEWGADAALMRFAGAQPLDPAIGRLVLTRPFELGLLARMTRVGGLDAHLDDLPGKSRPARTGRNPSTGEPIAIVRSTAVTFRAGKGLKDALN